MIFKPVNNRTPVDSPYKDDLSKQFLQNYLYRKGSNPNKRLRNKLTV